jgi:uncharacterized membrane protein YeaQ/YmgE (transglycosylase-associated protein family)
VTADQIFVWFAHSFDGPFTVLLILLAALGAALWMAQHRGKLDMANMFKDDAGKESGLRFAILGSWVISSWYLMASAVKEGASMGLLGTYLLFWSGAPIAARLIDKWDGSFPGKPHAIPPA